MQTPNGTKVIQRNVVGFVQDNLKLIAFDSVHRFLVKLTNSYLFPLTPLQVITESFQKHSANVREHFLFDLVNVLFVDVDCALHCRGVSLGGGELANKN